MRTSACHLSDFPFVHCTWMIFSRQLCIILAVTRKCIRNGITVNLRATYPRAILKLDKKKLETKTLDVARDVVKGMLTIHRKFVYYNDALMFSVLSHKDNSCVLSLKTPLQSRDALQTK